MCVALLIAGCTHYGYSKDRTLRALHIFGIGWIMHRDATNQVKAFAIGSMDATHMTVSVVTNAPMHITPGKETNAP